MKALKHTDKVLLIVSILLFSIGLIMIFSASNIAAFMRYHKTPYNFLFKQGGSLIIGGLFVFLPIINMHTKTISALSWLALIVSLFLLAFVYFFGPIINDARSWISLGPISFQPSELVKVVLIVWYAAYFELKRKQLNEMRTSIFPLCVSLFFAFWIVLQPDFGTAGIIVLISFMLYFLIPVKMTQKLKIIGGFGGALLIVIMGYYIFNTSSLQRQISRFDYRYPCSEEKFYTTGNQVCNSYIAFNNGGLLGKGLGNSTQKYLYLPESHTDFIFAIVVEELGFLMSTGIILLYGILIWRIIKIGKESSSSRGSIMCYGVAIYIFLHTVINLLGIMGVLPLTGVPLPFLSYGGTFTLCIIGALSIVQRVAIETKEKKLVKS